MRILDARENEQKYAEKKCGCNKDFINMKARNVFKIGRVVTSMIKCSCRHDHYGFRDAMINDDMVEAICSRCERVETWYQVIKCKKTILMRKEFISELLIELIKCKHKDMNVEIILSFIENIMRYSENKEDEEHETNQQ